MQSDDLGLGALISEYWDLAYAEGAGGRTTDTPDGDAQRVRSAISAAIERLVAERDEARKALKPFAKYGELHAGQRPEFVEIGLWTYNSKGEPDGIELKSRDFFRARQALGKTP